MSRSNAPLALSVVTLTEPGSVEATLANITQFDDRQFGFNHNQTWAAMPLALRGKLEPEAVSKSFTKEPVRIQRCITALCELGKRDPLDTFRFQDYPEAGLRTVSSIDWDPQVTVKVKASCWYMRGDTVVIPVLQPRKSALSMERLSVYLRLVIQAYCKGDWIEALVQIIDLSGDADVVSATPLTLGLIEPASDLLMARYVKTFVEAKKAADEQRSKRPKAPAKLPLADLLGLKE